MQGPHVPASAVGKQRRSEGDDMRVGRAPGLLLPPVAAARDSYRVLVTRTVRLRFAYHCVRTLVHSCVRCRRERSRWLARPARLVTHARDTRAGSKSSWRKGRRLATSCCSTEPSSTECACSNLSSLMGSRHSFPLTQCRSECTVCR